MQTEKEYLGEISQILDSINRSTDESRKQEMKNHLHQKLYPKKYRYGFTSIDAVRKSVGYLKAGKDDPTLKQRYDNLKRTIAVLSKIYSDYEKDQQMEKSRQPKPGLSLLYDKMKDRQSKEDRSSKDRRGDKESRDRDRDD